MKVREKEQISVWLDGRTSYLEAAVYGRRAGWYMHKSVMEGVTPLTFHSHGRWSVTTKLNGKALAKGLSLRAAKMVLEAIAKELPKPTKGDEKKFRTTYLFKSWCRLRCIGRPPTPILEKKLPY